jgi:hypothetical protein
VWCGFIWLNIDSYEHGNEPYGSTKGRAGFYLQHPVEISTFFLTGVTETLMLLPRPKLGFFPRRQTVRAFFQIWQRVHLLPDSRFGRLRTSLLMLKLDGATDFVQDHFALIFGILNSCEPG